MDSDTKKKVRKIISQLDCMCPGLPCFFCAYYKACKAIMHWYNSLDSVRTKENEE